MESEKKLMFVAGCMLKMARTDLLRVKAPVDVTYYVRGWKKITRDRVSAKKEDAVLVPYFYGKVDTIYPIPLTHLSAGGQLRGCCTLSCV